MSLVEDAMGGSSGRLDRLPEGSQPHPARDVMPNPGVSSHALQAARPDVSIAGALPKRLKAKLRACLGSTKGSMASEGRRGFVAPS